MADRLRLAIVCTAALTAMPAIAGDAKPKPVAYKKDSGVGLGAFGGKLLHSYGYKDKKLPNGNWLVIGQAKSSRREDSQYIAIFRAAELAAAENKKFIRVVSLNGKSLGAIFAGANTTTTGATTFSGPDISYGTRYEIEVELTDVPDSEASCSTDVLRSTCKSIEVAGAFNEIRPYLKIQDRK